MQHTTPTKQSTLKLLRALIPDREIGYHELQRIAELQANQLRAHLFIAGRLDTKSITGLAAIKVEHDPKLPTSGMSFWDGKKWVILLRSTEPETRQRFTLLHELHHIISHPHRDKLFGKDVEPYEPAAEHMADYFAACALMPQDVIQGLFDQNIKHIDVMAIHLGVSDVAMRRRLKQLGLTNDHPRYEFSTGSGRKICGTEMRNADTMKKRGRTSKRMSIYMRALQDSEASGPVSVKKQRQAAKHEAEEISAVGVEEYSDSERIQATTNNPEEASL